MKAAVVPAARARWEVKEVPTPEPGPNQVLIRIRASGLCYTEVHITHGFMPTARMAAPGRSRGSRHRPGRHPRRRPRRRALPASAGAASGACAASRYSARVRRHRHRHGSDRGYMVACPDVLLPEGMDTSRPRRSSARGRCGAASAWPSRSHEPRRWPAWAAWAPRPAVRQGHRHHTIAVTPPGQGEAAARAGPTRWWPTAPASRRPAGPTSSGAAAPSTR